SDRTVPWTINAGAKRICAARECGPFLENVVEINGPSASDEMGLVRDALGRERGRELTRRAAKLFEVELEKIQKVTMPAAGRHMLGRNARNFAQQLVKFRAELIPTAGDFLDAFELRERNGSLKFGHLVIRRQEKGVTDFFLALVTLIQKQRGQVAEAVIVGNHHATRAASDMFEMIQRER